MPTTRTTATTASTTTDPSTKATPAKPKATKAAKAKPAKAKATKAEVAAKPRAAKTAVRKDAPRTGELTGAVLDAYNRVLAATPKAKADALNANAIAKKLSDEAGKTVWPVPTKKHLETAVVRGDVVKVKDGERTLYHRK
jgi:hypothetical protein